MSCDPRGRAQRGARHAPLRNRRAAGVRRVDLCSDEWLDETGDLAGGSTTAVGGAALGGSNSAGAGQSAGTSGSNTTGGTAAGGAGNGAPSAVFRSPNSSNVLPDTRLRIRFDNKPSINSGAVTIHDAATGALVDSINVAGESDVLGYPGQTTARNLKVIPAAIIGEDQRTISINPHTHALALNKTYYVLVSGDVFSGTMNGQAFSGFGAGAWQFSTTVNGFQGGSTLVVDDDGPADFASIQGALNYVMQSIALDSQATIQVRNGIYTEALFFGQKHNVTISGESRDSTVIQFENYNGLNGGPEGRPLFLIQDSDLFTLENLTVHNTHLRVEQNGDQAEAVYFDSKDHRMIAKNAAFISEQDTVLVDGYVWFYNTLVAGNVDFIWGGAHVALFENSEIRSLGDSHLPEQGKGGYVVQSRVRAAEDRGFVFLNSTFTRGPGPTGNTIPNGATALGRTGNSLDSSNPYYDSMAFINCKMDGHISAAGFYVAAGRLQFPAASTATAGYREFGSTDLAGNPLDLSTRQGAYTMSAQDVSTYYSTRSAIFASFNAGQGWNPSP